jgi:hypothetical protein
MSKELAKAIFAKHSAKLREKEYQKYLKTTKGASRMEKNQWYRFNYGVDAPEFRTGGTKKTLRGLREAGIEEGEILTDIQRERLRRK